MNDIVITYSLIKSVYERGKDYIDVFVPFLLISFPDDKQECEIHTLSENIKNKVGLEIPEHTLNTIIVRATRSGYLTRKERKCIITQKGYEKRSQINSDRSEEERKINALIEDIINFIENEYDVILATNRVLEILNSFIRKYQLPLLNFFNPRVSEELKSSSIKDEFYLIEYLKLCKKQKPTEFNLLEKIFYGALISTLVNGKDVSEIKKKFRKLQIFLDTNFMFSVLGLHYPHICKPAKELFDLLKSYEFQIKVFDFTIDEMVRVLQGYTKESYKYFPNIKVDSIYSNLKSKGWTREDCIQFITGIEQKIYELGIQVEYTQVDLKKWEIPNHNEYLRISQFKPDQNPFGQKHDICAIEKIREIRKHTKREIEKCSAIFLTSDLRLARFDFLELGHKENLTVSEVVSDRFLTTLLWLKNSKMVGKLPLEMILSTQSELLVDRRVWDRFYDNFIKLKKDRRISGEDISSLIYYHEVELDLSLISEPEEITEEFVVKEIEKNKRKMEESIKQKIAEEIKQVEEKYTEEMAKKDREYLEKLKNIKSNLKHKADNKAKKCSNLIWLIPIVLFCIGIIFIKSGTLPETIITFIAFIISSFGIKADIFKLKKKIYDYCFNRTCSKLLYELQLNDI